MWTVQSFVREELVYTGNGDLVDYYTRIIGERNGTVLNNVFATSSASTIAKNMQRVRAENRSFGSTIKSATLFTMITNIRVTSMTMPDGTVIGQ